MDSRLALVGIRHDSVTHFPLPDALGSVRILLDAGQNWTDGYSFDAFGNEITQSGTTVNPCRYVGSFGYYMDSESGLDLLTLRYYDAAVGQFLTRDPIGFKGGDWSLYRYVLANPQGRVDPMGLVGLLVTIGAIVIGGAAILIGLSGCSQQKPKPRPPLNPCDHKYIDSCKQVCKDRSTGISPTSTTVTLCCSAVFAGAETGEKIDCAKLYCEQTGGCDVARPGE